jgi:citrate lyase subunit beta/citryl-CoA lyase
MAVRSLLFLPADRPAMAAKIPAIAPDVAVLDLEDAVATGAKHEARRIVETTLAETDLGGLSVVLRVNPLGTPWFEDDLRVATDAGIGVVLPKYEDVSTAARVREAIGDQLLVVGLETGRGVADCRELLQFGVDACYFGAEDYVADLGGRRTAGGSEVLWARSQVVLAGRLAGVDTIDQAVVSVHDDDAFRVDADRGRDLGYHGKICLHPRQVETAHEVFSPTEGELSHARRVLAEAGGALGSGVAVVDGQMVDEVHLKMARATVARAGEEQQCASE